jgi:hypothetical protein
LGPFASYEEIEVFPKRNLVFNLILFCKFSSFFQNLGTIIEIRQTLALIFNMSDAFTISIFRCQAIF